MLIGPAIERVEERAAVSWELVIDTLHNHPPTAPLHTTAYIIPIPIPMATPTPSPSASNSNCNFRAQSEWKMNPSKWAPFGGVAPSPSPPPPLPPLLPLFRLELCFFLFCQPLYALCLLRASKISFFCCPLCAFQLKSNAIEEYRGAIEPNRRTVSRIESRRAEGQGHGARGTGQGGAGSSAPTRLLFLPFLTNIKSITQASLSFQLPLPASQCKCVCVSR